MELYLTDVKIVFEIIINLTKSEKGNGTLKIILPKGYYVNINYTDNPDGSLQRTISLGSNDGILKEWCYGDIVPEDIESCLKELPLPMNNTNYKNQSL